MSDAEQERHLPTFRCKTIGSNYALLLVVGTYKYEIAEQKTVEATNASRNHGFPLALKMEEE